MSNWREFRLEDIALDAPSAMSTGPFGSSISSKFFQEEGVPVIRGGNLSANVSERMSDDGLVFVSKEKAKEFKRSVVRPGDLIFTCWGTINQVGIITDELEHQEYIISNKQMKLTTDPEKADSLFLYYLFSSPLKQAEILNNAIGAAVPGFNLGQLKKHIVYLPPVKEQKRIASLLSSYDTKIRHNRQTNQTLEHIAQAIFKNWFVDFEPTRAKLKAKQNGQDPERAAMAAISGLSINDATGAFEALEKLPQATLQQLKKTANLFPDVLVDSELGEVPDGWKDGCLGDIATAKGGYAFKGKSFIEEGNPVVKIKNITGDGRVNINNALCINDAVAKASERFKLTDGDLLMAMTGATVGKIGFVVTGGRSIYLNQRVAKFESEKFGEKVAWFLFCCLERNTISESIVSAAQGSAQPNISSYGIESTKIIVPSDDLVNKFCDITNPFFKKWLDNIKENEILQISRDSLLPRLLSGEINIEVAV